MSLLQSHGQLLHLPFQVAASTLPLTQLPQAPVRLEPKVKMGTGMCLEAGMDSAGTQVISLRFPQAWADVWLTVSSVGCLETTPWELQRNLLWHRWCIFFWVAACISSIKPQKLDVPSLSWSNHPSRAVLLGRICNSSKLASLIMDHKEHWAVKGSAAVSQCLIELSLLSCLWLINHSFLPLDSSGVFHAVPQTTRDIDQMLSSSKPDH